MLSSILYTAALVTLASAHGVILAAQGEAGSPASVGFQVDDSVARNCTGISPCQQDTTIIRDAEIAANIVNECGRTELSGNIDVGENTENAIAAKAITQVKAGSDVVVTLHQVNADGAGPYACDIDMTSNSGVISQNLTVTNNVPGVNGFSQAKTEDFNITVTMPDDLACTGASTGNVCTIRCRNNAVAGPFGGCFAVQQSDVTPTVNSANQIQTAQTKDGIDAQIAQNKEDFSTAVDANVVEGSDVGAKAADDLAGILSASVVSLASPTQTLSPENLDGAANAGAAATSAASGKKGKGNKNSGNGNGAAATATNAASSAATTAVTSNNGNANKGNNNNNNAATNGNSATGNGNGNGRANNNNNNNKKRSFGLKWAQRS